MEAKLILKEIANNIHANKDKYSAHEKIKKYFILEKINILNIKIIYQKILKFQKIFGKK